jgi:predicted transcriptional regulator
MAPNEPATEPQLTESVHVRVSSDELARLDELAGRLDRSRSWLLRRALLNLCAELERSMLTTEPEV